MPEIGITKVTMDFIQLPKEEERKAVYKFITNTMNSSLKLVLEAIAAKEGKPGDQNILNALMKQHGNDALLLSHRILDELMLKEY